MKGLAKHVAALSLGVVAFAAPLHAQTPMQFSLGAGADLPLGDFSNGINTGFHGTAAVGFSPASLPVGIQVDANYTHFGTDDDDVSLRTMYATGNAVYHFKTAAESKIQPYLIGGVGVYNFKVTDIDGTTKLGINAGAGFNVMAGGAALFVEGRFHDVFTDNGSSQFLPLTVGVRLGGK